MMIGINGMFTSYKQFFAAYPSLQDGCKLKEDAMKPVLLLHGITHRMTWGGHCRVADERQSS